NMRHLIPSVVVLVALVQWINGAEVVRTWTDSSGRYTIQALLLEVAAQSAVLETAQGNTVRVPLEKLSEADRAYIARQVRSIDGKVVGVTDGDTIVVLDADNEQLR